MVKFRFNKRNFLIVQYQNFDFTSVKILFYRPATFTIPDLTMFPWYRCVDRNSAENLVKNGKTVFSTGTQTDYLKTPAGNTKRGSITVPLTSC